jgi:hypothetical protein
MLGAFLMLGGVAYFTIIRDNFMEIDDYLRKVAAPLEQREELDLFFSMIKKMNNGILDIHLKNRFEGYFEYRWEKNMNWGLEN